MRMTTFEFEYEDESAEWEPLGTGQGSGEGHLAEALTDIEEGGKEGLVAGRYRYRPDDGSTEQWKVFTLDAGRRISLE